MQIYACPKRGKGVTVEKELRSLALFLCLSEQEELSVIVYFNVKTRGSDQSFLFSKWPGNQRSVVYSAPPCILQGGSQRIRVQEDVLDIITN